MAFDFEKLSVYKKSILFANDVYNITKQFPKEELFGLTGQLRRASVSITLNMAEGSGRTKKEFRHFLIMSRASIHECVAILEICHMQNYIKLKEKEKLNDSCNELYRMISGLINSLSVNC